jgi:hypothetical protein
MADRRRWQDLDPRKRKLLVIAGAAEAALKIIAVVDIARRPADQIRGRKGAWVLAVTTINSFGAVPAAYFLLGRRTSNGSKITK